MSIRQKACEFCPYKKNVPSGVWGANEYEKLREFGQPTAEQPVAKFVCHCSPSDLCTGWLSASLNTEPGHESLWLRLQSRIARDPVFLEQLKQFQEDSTEEFFSHVEAAEHGLRDMDYPTEEACDAAEKLSKMIERRVL